MMTKFLLPQIVILPYCCPVRIDRFPFHSVLDLYVALGVWWFSLRLIYIGSSAAQRRLAASLSSLNIFRYWV